MLTINSGDQFLHYKIKQLLGEGGMGQVFLAEDTRLAREVAIKFLAVDKVGYEEARKRFIREAQAAAKLDHANIARIYDVGSANLRDYIVMEYCEGRTLENLLQTWEFSINEILNFAIQILSALEAAHKQHIIHRDIKPANIIVSQKAKVKILDFGIAKFKRESELLAREDLDRSSDSLTGPDQILGSVFYVSPEQVLKEGLDARSDLFSFGVMLYEMLTRKLPFNGDDKVDIMVAIIKYEPTAIRKLRPNIPAELEKIVAQCLAKKPRDRFADARAARKAIQQLANSIVDQPEASFSKTNNTNLKTYLQPINILIGILSLIALFLGCLYLWRFR